MIQAIESRRGSRVICCLTSDRQNANGILAKDFIPIFFSHLQNLEDHDRVDLFMFTLGGDTLAAFGLSRLIREFATKVGCLVPEKCHSAGTLLAIGSDEIFMTRAATLSPIDPSVTGTLNPQVELAPGQRQVVPISVESVAGFKALVTEDWKLDRDGVNAAFRMLAERINPLALGDVYRSRQQIAPLARKLLSVHRSDKDKLEGIIGTLTTELGSHDYLISRTEAREMLTTQVLPDDAELEKLVWDLFQGFSVEMELGQVYDASMAWNAARATGTPTAQPLVVKQQLVVIESLWGRDVWERDILVLGRQVNTPAGPVETVQQQIVQNGWKHYD